MPEPATQLRLHRLRPRASRWMGRCPGCGEWNTLVEEAVDPQAARRVGARDGRLGRGARAAGRAAQAGGAGRGRGGRHRAAAHRQRRARPRARRRPRARLDRPDRRLPRDRQEHADERGARSVQARRAAATLYVSGEESAAQVRLRAERLGADALAVPVLAETSLEVVLASLEPERPAGLRDRLGADALRPPTSPARRAASGRCGRSPRALERFARERGCAVILVGHVTKEGALAGPRVLEHAVDCVLQFEGERERSLPHAARAQEPLRLHQRDRRVRDARRRPERGRRPLRALPARGRAGRRARACCARWRARGRCWSRCRRWSRRPRSCRRAASRTASTATGSACPGGAGAPRRARRSGSADVFVSVAGGVRIEEPGADLAVALAVASAARGSRSRAAERAPVACFGEIGLTGELRYVAHAERRLEEAARFGLERVVLPARCVGRRAARTRRGPRGAGSTLARRSRGARSAPPAPRAARPGGEPPEQSRLTALGHVGACRPQPRNQRFCHHS